MRPSSRRGFSLVELLIAIIIFGIVGASIFGLLTRTQRLSRTQADRATMQANIRAGMGLITSELRELNVNGTESDIQSLSATNITYRGMRGLSFVCEVNTGYIRVTQANWVGYRNPVAGDRFMLFVENDPDIATDDGWLERPIANVIQNQTCPDGSASFRFNIATNLPTTPDTVAMLTVGSPVRTYELMEIGELVQGGETWLGARSISAGQTFQPVLGPLATGGVAFAYRTSGGVAGATALTVRSIQLTLTGITDDIVAAGAGTSAWTRATEQLVTTIQLRNAQ